MRSIPYSAGVRFDPVWLRRVFLGLRLLLLPIALALLALGICAMPLAEGAVLDAAYWLILTLAAAGLVHGSWLMASAEQGDEAPEPGDASLRLVSLLEAALLFLIAFGWHPVAATLIVLPFLPVAALPILRRLAAVFRRLGERSLAESISACCRWLFWSLITLALPVAAAAFDASFSKVLIGGWRLDLVWALLGLMFAVGFVTFGLLCIATIGAFADSLSMLRETLRRGTTLGAHAISQARVQ